MRNVAPSGRARDWLPVAPTAQGALLGIPLLSVAGKPDGPTLVIIAGIHGDEAVGMEAVARLWEQFEPSDVVGTLLLLPIANPSAFAFWQRRVPHEQIDLNRIFPGRSDGTLAERTAHTIWSLVRGRASFLVTLHGWYAVGDCLPHVEIPEHGSARAPSEAAARAAGFQFIRLADWLPGLLPAVASREGIPCMEAEIGGLGSAREGDIDLCLDHLRRLMVHLGMIKQPVVAAAAARLVRRTNVFAPRGGWLRHRVALGTVIGAGAPVATVCSLDLADPIPVPAPVDGVVLTRREALAVEAGDMIASIMTDTT